MKIQKQFIPLILSGKKTYEFRNSDEHFNKIFKINGNFYWLKHLTTLEKKYYVLRKDEVFNTHIIMEIDMLLPETFDLTKEEYDWLLTNWNTYFADEIFIGVWERVNFEELKVI